MPLLFYFVLINILIRIGAAAFRSRREPKSDPICTTCSLAHMQFAVSGKRAISCTFGGSLHPIKINVMYCTDYRERGAIVPAMRVGFANSFREHEDEPVAEMASAER